MPGGEGLSYYGARWYDPKLGRFLSADTIVPGPANPQAFNRYSYVLNNPLKYIDPTGHCEKTIGDEDYGCFDLAQKIYDQFPGVYSLEMLQKSSYENLEKAYAELKANPLPPDLASVLMATLGKMGNEFPVSVSFDAQGNPVVSFDGDKLRKMVVLPLQGCAQNIGGVCGVSRGTSVNTELGAGVRGSIDVFADANSEFVILFTYGGGAYTPLPSPTTKYTIAGIPDAKLVDTDGVFAQLGTSGALVVGAAGEGIFGKADDGHSIRGQAYGVSTGMGADLYFTLTNSHVIYSSQYGWFNLTPK